MGMLDCADLCCHVTKRFSIFICFSSSERERSSHGIRSQSQAPPALQAPTVPPHRVKPPTPLELRARLPTLLLGEARAGKQGRLKCCGCEHPHPQKPVPGLDKLGVSPFTFPLQALDFQELRTMPGHRVTWPQLWAEGDALQGGDISQSLVKGHHVGGEVQGRQTARGAAEPPLLLAGGRARAPDQGIHLQGGVQEGVWFLHKQETALRPPSP